MILWAVLQLAKIRVHDRYRTAAGIATGMAAVAAIMAVHGHFIGPTPDAMGVQQA